MKLYQLLIFLLLWSASLWAEFTELQGKYTYLQARTACREQLSPLYRVPEIWELFTLKGNTAHYGHDKRYWSGNTLGEARIVEMVRHENEFFVNNEDIPAFAFYLQDGDVTPTPKFVNAYVLCTKDEKIMQSDTQFTKTAEGVKDTNNEILWEPISKERTNKKLDYESAQDYCDALELSNRSWRLPTIDELYSIVNYNYVKPSVSPKFGNMAKKYYWSDTPFQENKSYVVGFSIGSVATSPQINESHFRCVSDLE